MYTGKFIVLILFSTVHSFRDPLDRAKSLQLCLTLCDPMDYSPPGSPVHGCHALLQGIFPTQGSNPGLPHRKQTPYHLSHQGIPRGLRSLPPK